MSIRDYVLPGYVDVGYIVAPIDICPAFDPLPTIASQYSNSPTLLQLIESMSQYFDPAADFTAFYDAIWNIDTANDQGLSLWGKIVNVQRVLTVTGTLSNFAFDEQGLTAQPFGQAPFYAGESPTQTYVLTSVAYRNLILTKALANISAGSAQSINALLRNLFSARGKCYVIDLGNMSMQFTFEFALRPYEIAIMTQSGVMPRPAGVSATVVQMDTGSTFGFAEAAGSQPFNQGVFFNPDVGAIPVTN